MKEKKQVLTKSLKVTKCYFFYIVTMLKKQKENTLNIVPVGKKYCKSEKGNK